MDDLDVRLTQHNKLYQVGFNLKGIKTRKETTFYKWFPF